MADPDSLTTELEDSDDPRAGMAWRRLDFSRLLGANALRRLIGIVVALVLALLTNISSIFLALYLLYVVAVVLPGIAIAVRRLHDTGKSGWYILLGLIPLVGFIILIVFYVQPSDGPNEYGAAAED